MEVEEMPVKRVVDPADVAADVSLIISEHSDISQNDAIIRFMCTETFCGLLSNPCLESMDPRLSSMIIWRRFHLMSDHFIITQKNLAEMKIGIMICFSKIVTIQDPLDLIVPSAVQRG
ncbi:MAG: hypothetical protein ACI38Y_01540, partial [Candidatus Methanomethylophilaceae archaeon]